MAVKAFTNILAEVRAYGEGFLIAEQIPSKLVADVIKNTNLKIIHRLPGLDDQELMGKAKNLQEAQLAHINNLRPGEAIVRTSDADEPVLVQVPDIRAQDSLSGAVPKESDVQTHMESFLEEHSNLYKWFAGCDLCAADLRCPMPDKVADIVQDTTFTKSAQGLVFMLLIGAVDISTFHKKMALQMILPNLSRSIERRDSGKAAFCVLNHMLRDFLARKSRQYQLRPSEVGPIETDLLQTISSPFLTGRIGQSDPEPISEKLSAVASQFRKLCEPYYGLPFEGCEVCASQCLFRFEAEALIGDTELYNQLLAALSKPDQQVELMLRYCSSVAKKTLGSSVPIYPMDLSLCLIVQKMSHEGSASREERLKNFVEVVAAGDAPYWRSKA